MAAQGSIYFRCWCTDEAGNLLGAGCPQRGMADHGTTNYRIELPPDIDGNRRPRRRQVRSREEAESELAAIRGLVELAEPGDRRAAATVGDLIARSITNGWPLPSADEVGRRLNTPLGSARIPTVAEFADAWLPTKTRLAAKTRTSYESQLRLYIKPLLGDIRLDRLHVSQILDMVDEILAFNAQLDSLRKSSDPAAREITYYRKKVGPTTIARICGLVRHLCNEAARDPYYYLHGSNPTAGLERRLPKAVAPEQLLWTEERVEQWRETGRVPQNAIMVWTPELTGRFLDFATGDRLYALWYLMAFVGLRRGEACALSPADVSRRAGTLTIRRQLTLDGWTPVMGPTKTEGSSATIPIPDEVVEQLSAHQMLRGFDRDSAGSDWHDNDLLFTGPTGLPLHPAKLSDQFARMIHRAGLPPIRLHGLRHGAATLALASGVDITVVQKMLRHTDLDTTSQIYTMVLPQLGRDAVTRAIDLVPRNQH
jgi:integrase